MSNTSKKELILKNSRKERRLRQYAEMKKWDLGKNSGLECIENILDLEKVIFVGNSLKQGLKVIKGGKK